jgi:ABC-2 type transport system ATP-binding protein/lipopolysaccharide transport system ATP-binding protein
MLKRTVGGDIRQDANLRTTVRALSNLSLHIRAGDRLAVLGRNGSGKTTLLRVVGGIFHASRGHVSIQGTTTLMTDMFMGMDIEETGYSNILYRGVFLGLSGARLDALVKDVEDFTELGDFLSLPVRTYSQGMLLRLGFAISTAISPEVIIMDELINVGDAAFFRKAEQRLNKLFEHASIMVVATHDEMTVRRFCNRAILLREGILLADGTPDEVLATYNQMHNADIAAYEAANRLNGG